MRRRYWHAVNGIGDLGNEAAILAQRLGQPATRPGGTILQNFLQNSLLTGGTQSFNLLNYDPKENAYRTVNTAGYCHYGMYGRNAMAMTVTYSLAKVNEGQKGRQTSD
jgi:hypothetical protein